MVRVGLAVLLNLDVARGQGAERIAHPEMVSLTPGSPLSVTSNGTSAPTGVLSNVVTRLGQLGEEHPGRKPRRTNGLIRVIGELEARA